MASAKGVHAILHAAGVAIQSAETILTIENTYAHVDLPCSGVKSLFSVSILFLAASILERSRLGIRWLGAFALSCVFVIAGNLLRVLLLVAMHMAPLPDFAKTTLHAPIGVACFAGACLAAIWGWKTLSPPRQTTPTHTPRTHSRAAFVFLVCTIAAAGITDRIIVSSRSFPPNRPLAANPESLPLTGKERALFLRHGVSRYAKSTFSLHGVSGTALLVRASSWRGHHHPEQCLQAMDATVESSNALMLGAKDSIRFVTLKNSNIAVLYWFQSARGATDDYASRVWASLVAPGAPHIMNSIYITDGKRLPSAKITTIAWHFFAESTAMLKETP